MPWGVICSTAFTLAGKLIEIISEYATATEQRRAQLRADADAAWKNALSILDSLDGDIAADNVAADAAAAALPPK